MELNFDFDLTIEEQPPQEEIDLDKTLDQIDTSLAVSNTENYDLEDEEEEDDSLTKVSYILQFVARFFNRILNCVDSNLLKRKKRIVFTKNI